MPFEVVDEITSDALQTRYIIARTERGLAYVWTYQMGLEEVADEMIEFPLCEHGALVGSKEDLIWEVENCVGSFRDHGSEAQQEAAHEVVAVLLAAIEAA